MDTLARWMRDLHLYAGLFISPFVLVFSISVFYLVHSSLPGVMEASVGARSVTDLPLPPKLEQLSGRERIDALRPALGIARVHGEVGWIQHHPRENRLVIPVSLPGKDTTVTIDVARRSAIVEERVKGLADALATLHKSPGPHLVNIRRNWPWMRVWAWLADATVCLVLFTTVSGLYLWWLLRSQRKIGALLLVSGAFTFLGLVYAIIH